MKCQSLFFFWKNKKNISKCHLKILPRMLRIKDSVFCFQVFKAYEAAVSGKTKVCYDSLDETCVQKAFELQREKV